MAIINSFGDQNLKTHIETIVFYRHINAIMPHLFDKNDKEIFYDFYKTIP